MTLGSQLVAVTVQPGFASTRTRPRWGRVEDVWVVLRSLGGLILGVGPDFSMDVHLFLCRGCLGAAASRPLLLAGLDQYGSGSSGGGAWGWIGDLRCGRGSCQGFGLAGPAHRHFGGDVFGCVEAA